MKFSTKALLAFTSVTVSTVLIYNFMSKRQQAEARMRRLERQRKQREQPQAVAVQ